MKLKEIAVQLSGCGEKPIRVYGETTLSFKLPSNQQVYTWDFIVADSWSPRYDCLLGMDFLTHIGATIDLQDDTITFQNELLASRPRETSKTRGYDPVMALEDVTLRSGTGTPVPLTGASLTHDRPLHFEAALGYGGGVAVADALVCSMEGVLTIYAENYTPNEYVLNKGQIIGWVHDVADRVVPLLPRPKTPGRAQRPPSDRACAKCQDGGAGEGEPTRAGRERSTPMGSQTA